MLSLGPHLHVDGGVTSMALPWTIVGALPLMASALPARLMTIGFLGIGIVVAHAIARALPAAPRWRMTAGLVLVAGLALTAPPIPYETAGATPPAFFNSGGDVGKIRAGAVVLVTPFSSTQSTDAMYLPPVA